MRRRTHITIGITTALLLLRPETVPGCLCAVAGGIFGGWLPDIDLNTNSNKTKNEDKDKKRYIYYDEAIDNYRTHDAKGVLHSNYQTQTMLWMLIMLALTLGVDYYFGGGACQYYLQNHGIFTYIAIATFIGICLYGYFKTSHRTFMHSFLTGVILSALIWYISKPLALPFACGFFSHILVDLLNKRPGVMLLWPVRKSFKLNLAPADGKLDRVLGATGTVASLFFLSLYLIPSLVLSEKAAQLARMANEPAIHIFSVYISKLGIYLLGVNILTFICLVIIQRIFYLSLDIEFSDQDRDFCIRLVDILVFAGGAVGMLMYALIFTNRHLDKSQTPSNNMNLLLIPACTIILWIVIYIVIRHPEIVSLWRNLVYGEGKVPTAYIILLIFLIINLLSFFLYRRDFNTKKVFSKTEKRMLFLAFIGGAAGAYLALGFAGKKQTVQHFMFGLPLMMVMQDLLLAPLLLSLL